MKNHQMVNTEIKLIIFFAAEDGEALNSQQKHAVREASLSITNSRSLLKHMHLQLGSKFTSTFGIR